MHKRGPCRHAVSVCLSRSYILLKRMFGKMFLPSGKHTNLVFPYQTSWQYYDGDLPNGGVKCRWGRLKFRFSTNIWLGFAIGNCCTVVSLSRLAAGFLLTAGIGRPSATRYVITVVHDCVQCETDQVRSRAIHSHGSP